MKIRPIFKTIDIFSFIQFLSRQTNYIIKFFLLKVLYLVCGMDLRVAAKMMADLGCDYAVNMDGSSAIRMRVASGYTNGVKDPGQVCGNNNTKQDYYGTASCVYLT